MLLVSMPLSYKQGFQVERLVAIECAACVQQMFKMLKRRSTLLIMVPEKRTAPDSRMFPDGIVPR